MINQGKYYLHFDGIKDYIEVSNSRAFSIDTTRALTISAWIRPETLTFPKTDGSGYVHWLGKGEAGQHEWTFRMYSKGNTENRDNRISFYVFNLQGGEGIGSYFEDPVVAGEWIHVVGAADSERTYIYKNGELRKCDQYREIGDGECHQYPEDRWITPQHGTAPVRIGHRDRNSYFQGEIREVRFWNRLLRANEVADLYASNKVPQKGLVAEYMLTQDIALDTVGKHNGRIFGATWILQ